LPASDLPIVLDPVLVSSSGGLLLDDEGRIALTRVLMPRATLVTPNVPEAAALLGEPLALDEAGLVGQGQRLLALGSRAILLKGGHSEGAEAVDLLISAAGVQRLRSRRVSGSSRGTGCALASAIAASLVKGRSLVAACEAAKTYVLGMLEPGQTPPVTFG
jgi:hydroxymethylpyrimidine/phosphomethylpyrimidine kinase